MQALDRLESEKAFHDQQAQQRAAEFRHRSDSLHFDDDFYLNHETWIRPAVAACGDVRGKHALDLGCGHGMAAIVLARRGADVVALELSRAYLDECRRRALANDVAITLVLADAERLPFADASFDLLWGNAIVHHLDIQTAAREIYRVLRPGGCAVLCEPWGQNRLLRWARQHLPYPGKGRTPDEQPLRAADVEILRSVFPKLEQRGFQLLSMTRRVFGPGVISAALDRCDAFLLKRFPSLERYCRYVVLTVRRD